MVFKKIKQTNNSKGYTLMELVISIMLFSATILGVTEIFKITMQSQRDAIAAQNIQDNMRYIFETVAKEIRTAVKSNDPGIYLCKSFAGAPTDPAYKVFNYYTDVNGNQVLYFKNKDNFCVKYYISDYTLIVKREIEGGGSKFASTTPSTIKISNLKFNVRDDSVGALHSLQPLVNIKANVEVKETAALKNIMNIQTSVSSRYYE